MKLELKHISGYLPYGLLFYDERQEHKVDKMVGLFMDSIDFENWSPIDNGKIENYKPILRPISDLHKEVDGVVHIVELARIASEKCKVEFEPDISTIKYNKYHSVVVRCKKWESEFWYEEDGYFYFEYNGNTMDLYQLDLFNYLFEHHFDVYGLIDKGLAIDINTVK